MRRPLIFFGIAVFSLEIVVVINLDLEKFGYQYKAAPSKTVSEKKVLEGPTGDEKGDEHLIESSKFYGE